MTEIWVPYGPVEVSFDIKQENLSQVLEPQTTKISLEDFERTADTITEETIAILTGTSGSQKFLDTLLTRNKLVRRILYPKNLAGLARRKSQEFGIAAEPLNLEALVDIGTVDTTPSKYPSQIAGSKNLLLIASVHYDPLFGLTSAASELISFVPELKEQAFKRSLDELPCQPNKSNASWYCTRLLQAAAETHVLEIVEKSTTGILAMSYGEPEPAHAKILDYWMNNLQIKLPVKSERVIFGCGGQENDKSLTVAFARSFFNVVTNAVIPEKESKVCMLAECAQGLGSEALLRFVTGRYEPRAKLDPVVYFDGLEVLLSFYRTQKDMQLNILTTLPHYYASKFDFNTIRGAREAPTSLIQQGSRAKILVIPDGSTSYLASG